MARPAATPRGGLQPGPRLGAHRPARRTRLPPAPPRYRPHFPAGGWHGWLYHRPEPPGIRRPGEVAIRDLRRAGRITRSQVNDAARAATATARRGRAGVSLESLPAAGWSRDRPSARA